MTHPQNRNSIPFGELVATAFDRAGRRTSNRKTAALLASRSVLAYLRQTKRLDVARRLAVR